MGIRHSKKLAFELYHFEPETFNFEPEVLEAMSGGYDVHCHTMPDTKYRSVDEMELVHDMDALGMAAAVSKMSNGDTCGRAQVVNYYSNGKAKILGSMCLCHALGGLNPAAVLESAKMGLKLLWMPVKDAAFHQKYMTSPEKQTEGLYILDGFGNLKPEVLEILKILKTYNIALATGHMSPREIETVTVIALQMGINVIITHAENLIGSPVMSDEYRLQMETIKKLTELGAYAEVLCPYQFHRLTSEGMLPDIEHPMVPASETAAWIREIGIEHVVLGTDGGCVTDSYKCEYYTYIKHLMENGFSKDEIQVMIRYNPEKIFNIE